MNQFLTPPVHLIYAASYCACNGNSSVSEPSKPSNICVFLLGWFSCPHSTAANVACGTRWGKISYLGCYKIWCGPSRAACQLSLWLVFLLHIVLLLRLHCVTSWDFFPISFSLESLHYRISSATNIETLSSGARRQLLALSSLPCSCFCCFCMCVFDFICSASTRLPFVTQIIHLLSLSTTHSFTLRQWRQLVYESISATTKCEC